MSAEPVRFSRDNVARALLQQDKARLTAVVYLSGTISGAPEYVFYRDGLCVQRSEDPFLERTHLKREDGVYSCDVLFRESGLQLRTN